MKTSKNACVALLCASLLNKGRTVLRRVARIEEVFRLLEVLNSIGVRTRWINDGVDLEIVPPAQLDLAAIDADAARRTRSIIMFLGPLLHRTEQFALPYAGGCDLGTRTIEPHMIALRRFGLEIAATEGLYHAQVDRSVGPDRPIVLTERGDTVTENALLAAARHDGTTVIRNASSNYMVQDLCFFLEALGVRVDGVGSTTLTVHGVPQIDVDVDYSPSEDPVEAMSLLAAAVVTESELTIRRVPIEFLEIELAVLEEMGLDCDRTPEYAADNARTRLVDLTVRPSKLEAPIDKIHPMPFPGLNIDNVPFFAAIAASAHGQTLIHDWVYDNRAIYLTDLNRLGGRLQLLDPHRVLVEGPTRWRAAEMMCPPALRLSRGGTAGDDGGRGNLGPPQRLCDQPGLRGTGRAPELGGRADRDLPGHLTVGCCAPWSQGAQLRILPSDLRIPTFTALHRSLLLFSTLCNACAR